LQNTLRLAKRVNACLSEIMNAIYIAVNRLVSTGSSLIVFSTNQTWHAFSIGKIANRPYSLYFYITVEEEMMAKIITEEEKRLAQENVGAGQESDEGDRTL